MKINFKTIFSNKLHNFLPGNNDLQYNMQFFLRVI